MDDGPRFEPAPPKDRADEPGASPAASAGAPHLADPRALTILTTEHWSLLTARSLVYNEAFSRGAMFLTFLSASLVALGFVAGSGVAGTMLPLVAIPILVLDLFVGLATLGRLIDATVEEFVALQGMARLRHAYLEIAPDLEPYFSAPRHDDIDAVLSAYGSSEDSLSTFQNVVHGLTTMPGMVMVIDSAIGGAIVAVLAVVLGGDPVLALGVGVLVGLAMLGVFAMASIRVFGRIDRRFETRFPSPPATTRQDPRRNT